MWTNIQLPGSGPWLRECENIMLSSVDKIETAPRSISERTISGSGEVFLFRHYSFPLPNLELRLTAKSPIELHVRLLSIFVMSQYISINFLTSGHLLKSFVEFS